MSWPIWNVISVLRGPDIGSAVVEVYDRITEDGLYRRKIEGSGFPHDREIESAP
jgi:hypothetical protein|tara:strand:- start:234 stop:395 length:162 start_codon:yes stop_codon:yes gene_type:complete